MHHHKEQKSEIGFRAGFELSPSFPSRKLSHRQRRLMGVLSSAMACSTGHFIVSTKGKGTYEITRQVAIEVARSGVEVGVATIFVRHTSCSLILMENADPSARRDLERFFEQLVPENISWFEHTAEGPDDSTSHIRSVLTRSSEMIPIADGELQLGTWQGIFLFEHRRAPHRREVVVNVMGNSFDSAPSNR